MLSDNSHEIRQQADSALSEFLQEIKNSPVRLQANFYLLILLLAEMFHSLISCKGYNYVIFLIVLR